MLPSSRIPVLVIVRDAALREALMELLSDRDYNTLSAASAREGWELLGSDHRKPVVLLDLPPEERQSLFEWLSAQPEHARAPVVVLGDGGDVPGGGNRVERVPKPIELPRLLGAIQRLAGSG